MLDLSMNIGGSFIEMKILIKKDVIILKETKS